MGCGQSTPNHPNIQPNVPLTIDNPHVEYDVMKKIMLLGDSSVGKTSLVMRYSDDTFESSFTSTIGVDFKVKDYQIDGKKVRVQLWDTAGQERYRTIISSYFRGSSAVLIVFDLTAPESLENVRRWVQEISKKTVDKFVIVLVGNKADLKRAVKREYALEIAREIGAVYYETSAKSGMGVSLMFDDVVKMILKE